MESPDGRQDGRPALRATCWGTRGSIPAPGPDTVRFGGNTPCLEVRAGGRCYLFDAGTGMRAQGRRLVEEARPVEADVFLSHYHWDHIQGFPFWLPLFDADTRVRVHGPSHAGGHARGAVAGLMGPLYFPVSLEQVPAAVEFSRIAEDEPWTDGRVEVAVFRVNHPGATFGYRVRAGGASLAYVPDNDLGEDAGAEWYASLVAFLGGVDLLVHDAMFTDAEYARFGGWGHSTFSQAVRLAEDAGARRLALFHHAPHRTDAELARIADELRGELAARGSALELSVATEGEEVELRAGTP